VDLPIISPDDPFFGKFLPDDPKAATAAIGAGEWGHATIRAMRRRNRTTRPGRPPALGGKTVTTNSTTTGGPLIIRTLSFPDGAPAFFARDAANPAFRTFGGTVPISITGSAPAREEGNLILQGRCAAPTWVRLHLLHRHRGLDGLRAETAAGGGRRHRRSGRRAGDPQTGPKATVRLSACGDRRESVHRPDPNVTTLSFTSRSSGVNSSCLRAWPRAPAQRRTTAGPSERSSSPGCHVLTYAPSFPTQLTYNNGGVAVNLRALWRATP
jgi:hypothetical protein